MKKYILTTLVWCATFVSAIAQHDHSNHQKQSPVPLADTTSKSSNNEVSKKQLAQLLTSYYHLKNALVAGDASSAASGAAEFLKTVNTIDYKVLSEGNIHVLAKDAGKISATKDLVKQRTYFTTLSSNIAEVAKGLQLSSQSVYLQYCPMKKAYWLSSEKEIRNPYYGSSMLTCGEVTGTL